MIWLAGAIGALLLGWWLLRAAAHASVAQVKRGALWFAVGLLLGGVVLLVVLRRLPQALGLLLPLLPILLPTFRRWWARRRFAAAPPPDPDVSMVETATLAMRLDRRSGTLSGRVRAGRFAGRELAEMPLEDCLALLADCRAGDPDSVPLLESWLDRTAPDWRGGGEAGMSHAEALDALGLQEGATPEAIRAAYLLRMRGAHPDHGGDPARAARLNRARDILLGR
jgi:hypothetical protein